MTFSVIRNQCYYTLVGCDLFNVCVYVHFFLECTYGLHKDVEEFLFNGRDTDMTVYCHM